MIKSVGILGNTPAESYRHLFNLKTMWKHLQETFRMPKGHREESLVQGGSFTQICLDYYSYSSFWKVKVKALTFRL